MVILFFKANDRNSGFISLGFKQTIVFNCNDCTKGIDFSAGYEERYTPFSTKAKLRGTNIHMNFFMFYVLQYCSPIEGIHFILLLLILQFLRSIHSSVNKL